MLVLGLALVLVLGLVLLLVLVFVLVLVLVLVSVSVTVNMLPTLVIAFVGFICSAGVLLSGHNLKVLVLISGLVVV